MFNVYNLLYFQCRKKTFPINETVDKKQKNDTSESGFTGQAIGSKFVEKTVSFIKLKCSILCYNLYV